MYDGRDRRRFRRAKAEARVDLERYDSEPMLLKTSDASSKNVSAAGLLVHFDKPLPVPSMVLARFSLPGESGSLEVVARVVRCLQAEKGYDIGLEFLDTRPLEIDKIEKYVGKEAGDSMP